ncbi:MULTISPECIES: hypothetical protein [unclassified Janthinobacterium]|uniref:hypothetical protein n=1 Tax=unclassified Janthinobacterium TaxID=2610881 RepID=UPI00034BD5DB|nr:MULTISPECIES: hypothetical protein [unclassified Janthinobacterium]MEC5162173.1 hypothetical protein [Janthinobacterium sp. CG_S6]
MSTGVRHGRGEAGFGKYREGDGGQRSLKGSAGLALDDQGWLRVAAELAERDATNRAGADVRNPKEPRYSRVNQRFGDPDSKPRSAFANAQYRLSAGNWNAHPMVARYGSFTDNVTDRYPRQVMAQNNLGGTQPYSVFAPNGSTVVTSTPRRATLGKCTVAARHRRRR